MNDIDDERRQYGLTFSDGKTMMWTIMVMTMLKKDKMRRMTIITHGHLLESVTLLPKELCSIRLIVSNTIDLRKIIFDNDDDDDDGKSEQ